MNNTDVIQAINRIQENDKAEQVKRGERKPTNRKLIAALAVIATVIVLVVPPFLFAFLFPDADTFMTNVFIYSLVVAFFGAFLLWRRIRILRFVAVKNAKSFINLIEVDMRDRKTMETIVEKDALIFTGDLNDKTYDLIYNWLKHRQMLRGEQLNIYSFMGNQLCVAVPDKNLSDLSTMLFYAIRLDEIAAKDSPQWELFAREHSFIIRGRWLSDVIANFAGNQQYR